MPKTNAAATFFRIGHVSIRMQSDTADWLRKIREWMPDFVAGPNPGHPRDIAVTLLGCVHGQPLPYRVPSSAVLTFENETAKYYAYRNLWIAEFPYGIWIINRESSKATAYADCEKLLDSVCDFEDFMHPFSELLRKHRLYPFHGASVARQGRGLLLLGKSGQGKSTLTADLIHHGFDYLADDRCFLRETDEGIEMIGFYEPFKLFASNVTHIDALADFRAGHANTGKKENLRIEEIYPDRRKLLSGVDGLLFPHWSPGRTSALEPLTASWVLKELLPLTMVCFDRSASREHFDFSAKLAARTPAARLILGDDRHNWHRLVLAFMAQTQEAEI